MLGYSVPQTQRILREFQELVSFVDENKDMFGCHIDTIDNLFYLRLTFGSYQCVFFIKPNYPFAVPVLKFSDKEKLYHPNISPQTGFMALDPFCFPLTALCMSIKDLLEDPSSDSNCWRNKHAQERWLSNKEQYYRIQKHWYRWSKIAVLFELFPPDIVFSVYKIYLRLE